MTGIDGWCVLSTRYGNESGIFSEYCTGTLLLCRIAGAFEGVFGSPLLHCGTIWKFFFKSMTAEPSTFSSLSMGKGGPFASFVLRLGRGAAAFRGGRLACCVVRCARSRCDRRSGRRRGAALAIPPSRMRGRLRRDGRGAGRSLRVEGRRGAVHAAARRPAAGRMTLRRRAGRSWLRFASCRRGRKAGAALLRSRLRSLACRKAHVGGFLANAPWMRDAMRAGNAAGAAGAVRGAEARCRIASLLSAGRIAADPVAGADERRGFTRRAAKARSIDPRETIRGSRRTSGPPLRRIRRGEAPRACGRTARRRAVRAGRCRRRGLPSCVRARTPRPAQGRSCASPRRGCRFQTPRAARSPHRRTPRRTPRGRRGFPPGR